MAIAIAAAESFDGRGARHLGYDAGPAVLELFRIVTNPHTDRMHDFIEIIDMPMPWLGFTTMS